jgi:uncharacterized protein (TIGR03435 family)
MKVVWSGAVVLAGVFGVLCAAVPASAQAPPPSSAAAQARPSFEVASVKPTAISAITPQALQSGQVKFGLTVTGARVDIGLASLADLIRMAYNVKPFQVTGPEWMAMQRYDITAKLPDGATKDDVNPMLQTLLAERFGLVFHREKKELPVYALVVRDAGKLKPSAADADAAAASDGAPLMTVNGQSIGQVKQSANGMSAVVSGGATGPVKMSVTAAGEHIEAMKITMPALADLLAPMLERPVVDMTERSGTYQVALDIPLQELMAVAQRTAATMGIAVPPLPPGALGGAPGAAAEPGGGASIFQSVQQSGLRLEPRNAPVDVIVVDSVNRTPTED